MKTYVDLIAPTFLLILTGLPVAACVPAGWIQVDAGGLQIAGGQSGRRRIGSRRADQRLRPRPVSAEALK